LGVVTTTSCLASLLSAQSTPDPKAANHWGLEGLRTAYCVRFLVEPKAAAEQLRTGFTLLPAQQDSTLDPALQQVIRSQPEFASWAPSNLCFYYLDAVQMGKRRIVERDPGRYQLLAAWSFATREQGNGPRRDLVVDLYASRENLLNAAHDAEIRLHELESKFYDRPADSTADIYSLKIGKTQLTWTGRAVGDSSRVDRPISEQLTIRGLRHGDLPAQLVLAPTWRRQVVGSLRVEGKGDLAKMLKASPIRFVGPQYHGGSGELRFSR
jgi:hypothetical protein